MTTLTPLQKSRLAKLLGEEITTKKTLVQVWASTDDMIACRIDKLNLETRESLVWTKESSREVLETEWPYVIKRIKERMTDEQRDDFVETIKVSREPEYDNCLGWLIEGAFADISEVADALWQTLGKEEACMSQFPQSKATDLTERIMADVRRKNPDMPIHTYNEIFSAIWKVLSEQQSLCADAQAVQTLERELTAAQQLAEEYRSQIPTTAQAMAYLSLLEKFNKATERADDWEKVATVYFKGLTGTGLFLYNETKTKHSKSV
jgi:hypothetical protein